MKEESFLSMQLDSIFRGFYCLFAPKWKAHMNLHIWKHSNTIKQKHLLVSLLLLAVWWVFQIVFCFFVVLFLSSLKCSNVHSL